MTGSELPTWRQIFGKTKQGITPFWTEEECIFTSCSGQSLNFILNKCKEYNKSDRIVVWIPAYFCCDTESFFQIENIHVIHYPINDCLDPDWNAIKYMEQEYKPDVFLLVHYFGIYHDASRARLFCDMHNSILIEDCAHVLYQYGKFGNKSDFTIYSPHKLLPLPDGAIIYYNREKEDIKKIGESLKQELAGCFDSSFNVSWRVKRILQKCTGYRRNTHFEVGVHIETIKEKPQNKGIISKYSFKLMKGYSYENLKMVSYIRNQNLRLMNYIICKISKDIIPVIDNNAACPYTAVYSLKKCSDKQKVINEIEKRGILVMYWPSLSPVAAKDKQARKLSEDYIVIPIHQGINIRKLKKKCKLFTESNSCRLTLKEIKSDETSEQNRKNIYMDLCNIPQDWLYGKIKSKFEGGLVKKYNIYTPDETCIGFVQAWIKTICKIPIAVRINRGPLLREPYNKVENAVEVLHRLKERIPIPFFWAPNLAFSSDNVVSILQSKWRWWNRHGYSSGVLNLHQSEEDIRKGLNSKWRNQLKSAEKGGFTVQKCNKEYEDFLKLYLSDQKAKGYKGIPENILKSLFEEKNSPLNIYYILNISEEIVAFDIIYKQNKWAHYLIGWNSKEGRKNNLNNFLLYFIAIDLKNDGIEKFDLGGIDYIYTEDIAKFKMGMNPECYQLMGEFFKI